MTTTAATTWSPRRRRIGRVAPPLVAAALVTLPAVAATTSGHLSVTGLLAVFLLALTVALLAATLGLRLIHVVDGPRATAPPTRPNLPAQHGAAAPLPTGTPLSAGTPLPAGTPLGRVPVARIPADQAIDGSAPRAARAAATSTSTSPSTSAAASAMTTPSTSQDTDMHRSAPTSGSLR